MQAHPALLRSRARPERLLQPHWQPSWLAPAVSAMSCMGIKLTSTQLPRRQCHLLLRSRAAVLTCMRRAGRRLQRRQRTMQRVAAMGMQRAVQQHRHRPWQNSSLQQKLAPLPTRRLRQPTAQRPTRQPSIWDSWRLTLQACSSSGRGCSSSLRRRQRAPTSRCRRPWGQPPLACRCRQICLPWRGSSWCCRECGSTWLTCRWAGWLVRSLASG